MTNETVEQLGIDLETTDWEEVAELLSKTNRSEYNILKLCEELTELQERLLKFHLKVPEKKHTMESITDEIGDVILRLTVFISTHNLYEAVDNRLEEKGAKLLKYYKEGKYTGGI